MRFAVEEREVIALDQISLHFPAGGITTVVGRSGCGKTTLLRILAGLEMPTSGKIRRGGSRRLGYVFQEPRLMPWQRVRENVAFGLTESLDKSEYDSRIALI